MNADTLTPRTDKFASHERGLGSGYYEAIGFARILERELAETKAKLDAEHELACVLQSQVDNHDATLAQVRSCLQAKLDAARCA